MSSQSIVSILSQRYGKNRDLNSLKGRLFPCLELDRGRKTWSEMRPEVRKREADGTLSGVGEVRYFYRVFCFYKVFVDLRFFLYSK